MVFMPGDNRARDAYDDWCMAMGGHDEDGAPLPRWPELNAGTRLAWEGMTDRVWTAATRASARMNAPAGVHGPPASAAAGVHGYPASAAAGVHGYPASAHGMPGVMRGAAVSAVPSMHP
jgi:hypothetical protein